MILVYLIIYKKTILKILTILFHTTENIFYYNRRSCRFIEVRSKSFRQISYRVLNRKNLVTFITRVIEFPSDKGDTSVFALKWIWIASAILRLTTQYWGIIGPRVNGPYYWQCVDAWISTYTWAHSYTRASIFEQFLCRHMLPLSHISHCIVRLFYHWYTKLDSQVYTSVEKYRIIYVLRLVARFFDKVFNA